MNPLHEDQIHNGPFIESCTHIWSDDVGRSEKSGVYDYYKEISERYGKPLVNHTNMPEKAILFVGMCHILESVFQALPTSGSYIIVHRTNDRPYTAEIDAVKPKSVKHVYTVDCQVKKHEVTAIPFGNASINGEDEILKEVIPQSVTPSGKLLFVRYNVNASTPHRLASLNILKQKPFATVIEEQIPQDEFYRQCKAHPFTMALAGCGADASRQWSAIQLGSIPIVTDCPEMRHFEDMPLVYCPKDMNEITPAWLEQQTDKLIEGNKNGRISNMRMRASYWIEHINEKRKEHGIS